METEGETERLQQLGQSQHGNRSQELFPYLLAWCWRPKHLGTHAAFSRDSNEDLDRKCTATTHKLVLTWNARSAGGLPTTRILLFEGFSFLKT